MRELRNAMEEDALTPPGPRVQHCPKGSDRLRAARSRSTQTARKRLGVAHPAERDVARLVCEGLANKEIAARLFVSPRTVQAHLTHIYTKLGIASRVQLVQEAAGHG